MFRIEEMIGLAALQRKIDLDSLDDHVDVNGFVLLNVAGKVLEGKSLQHHERYPEKTSRISGLRFSRIILQHAYLYPLSNRSLDAQLKQGLKHVS